MILMVIFSASASNMLAYLIIETRGKFSLYSGELEDTKPGRNLNDILTILKIFWRARSSHWIAVINIKIFL